MPYNDDKQLPDLDPNKVAEFTKGLLGHSPGERRDKIKKDEKPSMWSELVKKLKGEEKY